MASHTISVRPGDDITTTDIHDARGPIAGLCIDGTTLFLGDWGPNADASIADSANLLIGVLVGLRDAAVGRIRQAVAGDLCTACGEDHDRIDPITTPCPAQGLPDGVEFVGTVGQFLDAITDASRISHAHHPKATRTVCGEFITPENLAWTPLRRCLACASLTGEGIGL